MSHTNKCCEVIVTLVFYIFSLAKPHSYFSKHHRAGLLSWVCGWASRGSASLEVCLKCDGSFFSVEGSPASPLTSPGPLTPRRYLSPHFQQTQGRLPLEQWSHGLPWRLHPYLSLPSNSSFRQVPGHLALVTLGVPAAGTAPGPTLPAKQYPCGCAFRFCSFAGGGLQKPWI